MDPRCDLLWGEDAESDDSAPPDDSHRPIPPWRKQDQSPHHVLRGDSKLQKTCRDWTPPPLEQDLQKHLDDLQSKMRVLFSELANQSLFAPRELWMEIEET